ncbi:MAG: SBBP repeat-containing protein [Niameybacter sp.]
MELSQAIKMKQWCALPLSFEANEGQIEEKVKFLTRGKGYQVFFAPDEVILTLWRVNEKEEKESCVYTYLKIKLEGAKTDVSLVGENRLEGNVNYFKGEDTGKWIAHVARYEKIKYQAVYPGIDVVYYGQGQALEHDFLVQPHVDPSQIRLRFEGAEKVERDAKGHLCIQTQLGEVKLLKPKAYQEIEGVQKAIESDYAINQAGEVGFTLGEYDRDVQLQIDPLITYATYLGGSANDRANGIAIDSLGNAYVAGYTASYDFPITPGAVGGVYNGSTDVFITKLNADGTGLIYSTYLGGSNGDWGIDIAVDGTGNAYVTGWTKSSDFPTTPGVYGPSYIDIDQEDIFVTKLSTDGAALVYSTYLGGTGRDVAQSIAIDGAGNAYVTGWTFSTDFPLTHGSLTGWYDGFVTKLNADATQLIYSTSLSGAGQDVPQGIVVNSTGYAYVTGWTTSNDFPTTPGAYSTSLAGGKEAFVTQVSADGSALVYSTYLGGSGDDTASGIAIDSTGSAYVTGSTTSNNFPTTAGAYDSSYNGATDVFISKLDAAGANLLYSTYFGGSSVDYGGKIGLDAVGNIYVMGSTLSRDFPTIVVAYDPSYNGGYDGFLAKFDASGTKLLYSTYIGGSGDDSPYGMAVDGLGNVYITGATTSTDFPTTIGAYDKTYGGNEDAFILKFGTIIPVEPDMALPIVINSSLSSNDGSMGITFTVLTPNFSKNILLTLSIQINSAGVLGTLFLSQVVVADGSAYLFEVLLPIGTEIVSVGAQYLVVE